MEEIAAQKVKMFYGKNIETVLHALSLTLVPRELPPGRSLLVSLSRAEKSADGCIAVRFFTPYSSTASGPPSLTREGSRKSCFWATDGGAICNRNFLGSSRAPTPTGEIEIFVFATYGCAFCDRGDLGRIISSPTTTLFIFHYSPFIFLLVGEAISLPRIR